MSLSEIQRQKNIEVSIRMCLVDGKTIPEIANAINLSTADVQTYLSDRYIIDRYGIRTAQAIKDKIVKDSFNQEIKPRKK